MSMKPGESFDDYYKRIGVRPADARPVTIYTCPQPCGGGLGELIKRKRNWPKGCNYFKCKKCDKPLWVEIQSWD